MQFIKNFTLRGKENQTNILFIELTCNWEEVINSMGITFQYINFTDKHHVVEISCNKPKLKILKKTLGKKLIKTT